MATGTIKATGWKLLWSNSDDTASFTEQTISLDLSTYNEVRIRWKQGTDVADYFTTQIAIGSGDYLQSIGNFVGSGTMRMNRRYVDTSASGVHFYAARGKPFNSSSGASTDNGALIPAQIYAK